MHKGKCGPHLVKVIIIAALLALAPSWIIAGEQQFFALGNYKLDSGDVIRECILGYRTYGALNDTKSNAILFPTWYAGTSSELEAFIGPGKMLDTTRYFVIGVDSFGNGISSSPSNNTYQKGRSFPEFTIGDMVRAHTRLASEKFGIARLHAVTGISMGGIQAYHWAAAYPGLARKIIAITGTPRPTAYDLLFLETQLSLLEGDHTRTGWDRVSLRTVTGLNAMAANTPARFNDLTSRDHLESRIETDEDVFRKKDPLDLARQVKALITHDIYTLPQASANIARFNRSSMLSVISKQDRMVNPAPATDFATSTETASVVLDSDCGHYIFQCEYDKISALVAEFLEKP
jgi:homoserine O-acetyltransferase/O-succinyltransferase